MPFIQKNFKEDSVSEAYIKCERELVGLLLFYPQLVCYKNDLENLQWRDNESQRLIYFIFDRLKRKESIAIRDLYNTAIGNDLIQKFSNYGINIEKEINKNKEEELLFEEEGIEKKIKDIFWELYNKKSIFGIKFELNNVMSQLESAQLLGNDAEDQEDVKNLRKKLLSLKMEKIKLEEFIKTSKVT